MNISNSFLGRLESWQQGFLIVIIGVPSSVLAVSLFFSILFPSSSQPLLVLGFATFLVIFGFIGGYIAKNEYLKTYIFSILTIFILMVIILSLLILFDGGIFGISQSSDPFGSLIISMIFAAFYGIIIATACSIFLLPSLFLGSMISRRSLK